MKEPSLLQNAVGILVVILIVACGVTNDIWYLLPGIILAIIFMWMNHDERFPEG